MVVDCRFDSSRDSYIVIVISMYIFGAQAFGSAPCFFVAVIKNLPKSLAVWEIVLTFAALKIPSGTLMPP